MRENKARGYKAMKNEKRMSLIEMIKYGMVNECLIGEDWRVKIESIDEQGVNTARIYVNCYEPRKRKPAFMWNIGYDIPRNQIHIYD